MTVHYLADFPYVYTTQDESDTPVKYWQNDPKHNTPVESVDPAATVRKQLNSAHKPQFITDAH